MKDGKQNLSVLSETNWNEISEYLEENKSKDINNYKDFDQVRSGNTLLKYVISELKLDETNVSIVPDNVFTNKIFKELLLEASISFMYFYLKIENNK